MKITYTCTMHNVPMESEDAYEVQGEKVTHLKVWAHGDGWVFDSLGWNCPTGGGCDDTNYTMVAEQFDYATLQD